MNLEIKFVPTEVDLYPNFVIGTKTGLIKDNGYLPVKNQFARVVLCRLTDDKYRVAIWGADDCGYEKDFDSGVDAYNTFTSIYKITQLMLRNWPRA